MKAFVKTTNGTFPDQNFYLAWKGLNDMCFEVHTFENVDDVDITVQTPVFAGVRIFAQVMERLGIKYSWETLPKILDSYYGRSMMRVTLGEAKSRFFKDEQPLFVKPVKTKEFNGALWRSHIDLIPLCNVSDDVQVIVSKPVEFLSEFRVYVQDHEVVAVKHYAGSWDVCPQRNFIKEAIQAFKSEAPIAYSLDVGVTKEKFGRADKVIEVNDGTSLGNYGLHAINYAEMIVARWNELTFDHWKKRTQAELYEMARQTIEQFGYGKQEQ